MSTDWHDLPAGRAIDRLIAERLGHEVKDYSDNTGELYVAGRVDGWERWTSHTSRVPRFSTDLNESFRLLNEAGEYAFIKTWAWAHTIVAIGSHRWYAETPALAICRAWLAWMDEKKGN